jgi:ribulose-5-phosphate 4-epimerase/fuculose-1-phosphate aldolase
MNEQERLINDLVIANRILANEDVVDAYGHVSIRNPKNPNTFFMARSLAPELVTADDIVELDLEGNPVRDETRHLYLERFIHGGILEARPDVMAVVHAHAEEILPFGIANGTPLRPVIHAGSFIGANVPVWDIADRFGDTNLLVANVEQGRDLAATLADNNVALVGLPAAKCTRIVVGLAPGRGDQVAVAGRNRCAQPGLQALFARDMACLGILGHEMRLRAYVEPPRHRERLNYRVSPGLRRRAPG